MNDPVAPHAIECEDPMTEMWRFLELQTMPSAAEQLILGRHGDQLGRALLADKQADFAHCVQQAKEYFTASLGVSLATAPLFCYYGMSLLTVALAVIADRNTVLRSVPRQHGLKAGQLNCCTDVLDAECKVTERGIFRLAVKQDVADWHIVDHPVRHVFPGTHYAWTRKVSYGVQTVQTHDTLRLRDLMSRTPDAFYELAYHPGSYCTALPCSLVIQTGFSRATLEIELWGYLSRDEVKKSMSEDCPDWDLDGEDERRLTYRLTASEDAIADKLPVMRDDCSGGHYVALPSLARGTPLPELCELLAAGFLLSALARYYPQVWMGRPRGGRETAMLLERYLHIIRRKFPNLVLNELYQNSIRFVASTAR